MAAATNTTAGQILMGGDFSTSSTGSAPELRPTGVNSGTFTKQSLVIDAKGRILYTKTIPTSVILAAVTNPATASVLGLVSTGNNITNTAGTISIPVASATVLGVATPGSNMSIDGSGNLRVNLPAATTGTSGFVSVGSGFNVSAGTLSHASWLDATNSTKGMVVVASGNDTGFTISSGLLAARVATASLPGLVRIGSYFFDYWVDGKIDIKNALYTPDAGIIYGVNTGTGLNIASGALSFNPANIPVASAFSIGTVRIGSGLAISNQVLSVDLPTATASTIGMVKLGNGFSMDGEDLYVESGTTSTKGLISYTSHFDDNALQFWFSTSEKLGVIRGSTDVTIVNGIMSLNTSSVALKETANTFTKTQTVTPVNTAYTSSWTPDFSASNTLTMTASGNVTIASPTSSTAGQVSSFLITASSNCDITFHTNYKLNQSSTIALTTGQILSISVITLSSTSHITMVQGIF